MSLPAKKTTIYLDGDMHRVLRIKGAETDRSMNELITEAIRQSLSEDAEDLSAFNERAHEKSLTFEDALKRLKNRGKL